MKSDSMREKPARAADGWLIAAEWVCRGAFGVGDQIVEADGQIYAV